MSGDAIAAHSDAPDAFWTLDRAADALAGVCTTPPPRGEATLRAVATDTRAIAPGDLFVALAGEPHVAQREIAHIVGSTALATFEPAERAVLRARAARVLAGATP